MLSHPPPQQCVNKEASVTSADPTGLVAACFPSDGDRPEALTTPGSERSRSNSYLCLGGYLYIYKHTKVLTISWIK